MFFVTPDIGYIAGRGSVLKTVNGGVTWYDIRAVSYYDLSTIFFTDENTGYVQSLTAGIYIVRLDESFAKLIKK